VREGDPTDILIFKDNINGLAVTASAVALNAEGSRAVMTGAAGLALLHVLHGRWVGTPFGDEYTRMTFRTVKLRNVHRVRKGNLANILILKRYVGNLGMALSTTARDVEGRSAVMTITTGLALFHLLHG